MRSKHSLLFVLSLSLFVLFINAFVPMTDASLVYADGTGGGDIPIPKDTTGSNSVTNPDTTTSSSVPEADISLLDIISMFLFSL